jgi:hypothetical protein
MVGHFVGHLGGKHLGHGGRRAVVLPPVTHGGGIEGQKPGRLNLSGHIGDHPPETLELGNEYWRVDFLDILADNTSVVYRISKYPSPYIGYLTKQMIWNTSSGEQNAIGGSDIYITGLAMENDLFLGFTMSGGKRAVGTFQGDGSMRITATFQSPYGTGALGNETISPDKRLIVSGNGFGLHAWEYKEDALDFLGLVVTQEAIPNYGMDYLFSPDGKYLVFTSGGVAYLLGVAEQ